MNQSPPHSHNSRDSLAKSAHPPPVTPPHEVLIIKPSSLGDVVHTLPCLVMLRRAFPNARIRWLVNSEWAPLLENNPHLDEAVLFPRQELRGLPGILRIAPWARRLRNRIRA